jgi:hypothetical protein
MIKKTITLVAFLAIIALPVIWFGSCSYFEHGNNSARGYKLTVNYPVVKDSGVLVNVKDTIPIFYYNDCILYFLPFNYSEQVEDKLTLEEKRYHFFIYRKTEQQGYFYQNVQDTTKGTKFEVDSFLFKNAYNIKLVTDSLVLVNADRNNNDLLEKYVLPRRYDDFTIDSVYYYYSGGFNLYDYSFSKKLDSTKRMKLYKARFLYNERYSAENHITLPKRELSFCIQKMPAQMDTNSSVVFRKFELDHPAFK